MPTLTTPSFTDNISIIAAAVMAKGATPVRANWDLRNAFGGRLLVDIGKGGTTALAVGASVQIRPLVNALAINRPGGTTRAQNTTTAASTTCATSDSVLGQNALNVASVTGFAAGDIICIQDSGGGVTRVEWARVSKTATGILTLDDPLIYTHTAAGADTVRNRADSFAPIWLPGGCEYEVIVDYGAETTGDNITYRVLGQLYANDSAA